MDFVFVISKIFIYGVLSPLPFLAILLVAVFTLKNSPKLKIASLSALFLLYILSTSFMPKVLLAPLEDSFRDAKIDGYYDAVVCLGGGADDYDATNNLSSPTERRLNEALLQAKKLNIPFVFAGAGDIAMSHTNEAKAAQERVFIILDSFGIAFPRYFIANTFSAAFEGKSQDTYENARMTRELLRSNGVLNPKIVLVTSAAHMSRAKKLFELNGFIVTPKATDFLTSRHPANISPSSLLPSFGNINNSLIAIYSYFGLLKTTLLSR
jgi:uncharacterized SAM-binding protein YcdF (DUF218 family)